LAVAVVAGEHVHYQEVVKAVAVDIGGIDGHGREAHVTEGETVGGAEATVGIAEPDAVGGLEEIIAEVEVGAAVVVEVAKEDTEAPVTGRGGEGLTVLVEEGAGSPGHGGEPAGAVVKVEEIAFTQFDDFDLAVAGHEGEETVFGGDHDAIADGAGFDVQTGRAVAVGVGTIIGDVKVEVAVAVDIGEGEGGAAEAADESGVVELGEMSLAVIEEESGPTAQGIDQEVEVAVAIDIGKGGAGGGLVGEGDAGGIGDVLEAPIAEVTVEGIGSMKAAEVHIRPAVVIDIAEGHAGAEFEDAIGGDGGAGDEIGEADAGVLRGDEGESGGEPGRDVQGEGQDGGRGGGRVGSGSEDRKSGEEREEGEAEKEGSKEGDPWARGYRTGLGVRVTARTEMGRNARAVVGGTLGEGHGEGGVGVRRVLRRITKGGPSFSQV
jgi:hypothetical protein